jgi:predicted lipid-binding transport protein (Tim44 family)
MDELIARVSAALATDEDTARAAVSAILKFLDQNAPDESAPLLDGLTGARDALAQPAAAPGGLAGALGGLFGGGLMGLAGELQGLGLGLGDMQALGGEILDHGRGVAGDDAMAAIAQATGLDRYM